MKARRELIPGSGLPAPALLTLLAASVGLFLVYNGLLWRAPREASHVARFAVSYLVVIPLAVAFLGESYIGGLIRDNDKQSLTPIHVPLGMIILGLIVFLAVKASHLRRGNA